MHRPCGGGERSLPVWCLAALLALAPPVRAEQAPAGAIVMEPDELKTRDGTILRADVYRPRAEGKWPVLLMRTPYNRRGEVAAGIRMAQRGYVVILQDVRGRYGSTGEWNPFVHEALDGHDTVEWAAALPYSNGKVGMFGGSYV